MLVGRAVQLKLGLKRDGLGFATAECGDENLSVACIENLVRRKPGSGKWKDIAGRPHRRTRDYEPGCVAANLRVGYFLSIGGPGRGIHPSGGGRQYDGLHAA